MILESYIRDVPDFPKKGIVFKDITPLLNNRDAFQETIDRLAMTLYNREFTAIVGIESRGFIFGAALAYKLNKRFVPVRKRNKLPAEVHSMEYELEYGTDILEIHKDALTKSDRVVIIDDILATGGTIAAVEKLIELTTAKIEAIAFLIKLDFLKGSSKLTCKNIYSLLSY